MNPEERSQVKRALRAALTDGNIPKAIPLLRSIVATCDDPSELTSIGKSIEKAYETRPEISSDSPKILILGQSTTTWIKWSLISQLLAAGHTVAADEGEYDNVVQELQTRDLSQYRFVFLLPSNSSIYKASDVHSAEASLRQYWSAVWASLREKSKSTIIQAGFDYDLAGPTGLHLSARQGPLRSIRRMNEFILDSLQPGEFFVDLEYLAGRIGRKTMYDRRRYHWTKQVFSEAGTNYVARYLATVVKTLMCGGHKLLALDLDNTLWGGVVGEEGPQGIELGLSPQGEAFVELQEYVKSLCNRGILLSVATKNNPADALGPFRENSQMVLKESDISSFKASWNPKSLSLEETAKELNLGVSSFVFLDDNPVERAAIEAALPEVAVVPLSEEPADYLSALEDGFYFESLEITEADKARALSYAAEQNRTAFGASCTSLEDFLISLNLVGAVEEVHDGNIQRVVQLIAKTNQFNTTTLRLSKTEVEDIAKRGVTVCLSLKDKFGDYGLVGLAFAVPLVDQGSASACYHIPIFLMSCRVLGRTAEHFLFNTLLRTLKDRGVQSLEATYIPSAKNSQVMDLFDRLGFDLSAQDGDKRFYRMDIANSGYTSTFVHATMLGEP